jgi:ABC-2 type transport system ATP-binding protein
MGFGFEVTLMATAIEVINVTKCYSARVKRNAVHDLSMVIPSAQFFGLLGPDGAGKTTTLRIMATVLEATSGEILVNGLDTKTQAEQVRRRIGYMPQNFSLYPDLTVEENLNFFADIQHLSGQNKKERITAMLEFTRLQNFYKSRAQVLSGGMKKKLALACAMIHEPEILLLDEPSTGVDPISRRELWEILARVVRRGVTVVVSTPYMDEAERCHQVGVLYDGVLLTSGTPKELEAALPFQIIEVHAKPRKEMRRIVTQTPGILEWRPVGDRLRLIVPEPDQGGSQVLGELTNRLKDDGLVINTLHMMRPSLEDVFVHLVNTKRRAE